MPQAGELDVKGSVVRAYVSHLERSGLLPAVSNRASSAARSLLEAPPPSTMWIESGPVDEIVQAVHAVGGADAVRRLGFEGTRGGLAAVLEPVLRGVMRVFGSKPEVIYSRLDLISRGTLRGMAFDYRSTGERSGTVEVRFVTRTPPAFAFLTWQGALSYAFELCGISGTVEAAEIEPGGRAGRFKTHW